MEIKDRIKRIGQYFRGMQVETIDNEQIVYVIVEFPPLWIVDETIPNKFKVSIAPGNDGNQYYFCASIEDGFDAVFDAIDYNIEKMVTAQERAMLLKAKVDELRKLFEDESIALESLRTLDFTYKGKRKDKKIMVPTVEEKTNENEEEK